ncbi:MAG: GntR family transcriptional regulator, partial [Candidatus Methylomirabilis sp.]|nr:GntR family transcriptional regulator [Deltaproteobacteria bacterium]
MTRRYPPFTMTNREGESPMLQAIERKSLSDAVFEQLRARIVAGALAAGETLPSERALCETLQVNRGALREALKRL